MVAVNPGLTTFTLSAWAATPVLNAAAAAHAAAKMCILRPIACLPERCDGFRAPETRCSGNDCHFNMAAAEFKQFLVSLSYFIEAPQICETVHEKRVPAGPGGTIAAMSIPN